MMKLEIQNLEIPFFLGFYEEEKLRKTIVTFNISLEFDDTKFLKTKNFENLIDYDKLIQTINARFENSHFDLIEEVVFEVSEILSGYKLISYEINVLKKGTHANLGSISISKRF